MSSNLLMDYKVVGENIRYGKIDEILKNTNDTGAGHKYQTF